LGGTNQWYLGGIDKNKSIAFYYDIVNSVASVAHQKVFLQFQTVYQHVNGSRRMRVTTVQRLMSPPDELREMAYGFD
jgi:protein transport protein SEC23